MKTLRIANAGGFWGDRVDAAADLLRQQPDLDFITIDYLAEVSMSILAKLRSRAWRAGQQLPTERALGEQFGLSRSTVRRVLQDFKRKQLITQTVGSGTYVSEQVHEALIELAPRGAAHAVSPADLMSARLLLERLAILRLDIAGRAPRARVERDRPADRLRFVRWRLS